jgi:hypothetical protein
MAMSVRTVGLGSSLSKLRSMNRDRSGQVSFAVIAVVLLTASAITGTYMAKSQLDRAQDERRQKLLNAMEDAAGDVIQELSLCGASKAHETVSSWTRFPVNESDISDAYSDKVSMYIGTSYPRSEGKFTVDVSNWTGGLFFIERKTLDLIPQEANGTEELEIDGIKMDYERLPSPSAEVMGETTANPYYVALGNFSVRVSVKNVAFVKQSSFQRPIVSALPFLESKLRAFEGASDGELSDLGRLLGYMLSTLCELRVLEGYGQPMYSGRETSQVLTEDDVYRAVAVGLLLEQARVFRTVDHGFAAQVADACGGGYPGIDAFLSPKERTLDAAELFLWFLGITKPQIDSRMIIAQAVFGLSDALALRIMDYMGWLGQLDLAKGLLDSMHSTIDSFVSFLTGVDKSWTAVVSWIGKTLKATGADPRAYSELFSSPEDFSVIVPERQYFVEDASGNLYPVWVGNMSCPVNVPRYDLLSSSKWSDFYASYKECQTSFRTQLADGITRLAFDIADLAQLDMNETVVDPTDDRDLFESLVHGSGMVDLRLDRASLAQREKNLPMFSSTYQLATRFSQFVNANGLSLVNRTGLLRATYSDLATSVAASARYAYIPDLVVPVEQQIEDFVRHDVELDDGWGVGAATASYLDGISARNLERLVALVNMSIVKADDGFMGPLVDSVANMIAWGTDTLPGLEQLVEMQLSAFSRQVLEQKEFSAYKRHVQGGLGGTFEFWEGDKASAAESGRVMSESLNVSVKSGLPPMQTVPFDASAGYDSLEDLFPTDNMLVQVKGPWDFDSSIASYPNLHLTSAGNETLKPYSTQWTVSVLGVLDLALSTHNSAMQSILSDGGTESMRSIRIEVCIPVVVHSAWPLQGVVYNPTNTALSDGLAAARVCYDILWDKLGPVLGWVKDGMERIYKFVSDAFDVLARFANRVIKYITEAMQTLIENLQEYIQKVADSALGKAIRWFIDITGRVEFRFSMYGFLIIVQTNLPDLIYRNGNDMLRIIVCTDRFGPGIAFGVRIARLTDGSYDILANATLVLKNGVVNVLIDPLMHIMRRLVEVHCTAKTWGMDIVMPEVEPYDLARVSTSQIPGIGTFLSNIPIPILGLSASIEAGMELKYSPPFPTDVVVNEFESNPQGDDSGKEWVELYNPLGVPKCVDGWMVSTVHGKNSAMRISGTIAPNGLLTFGFPETSVDNGEPGDPFNDGDSIVLMDPAGVPVDSTPMLRDGGNDERTNQRSWDGGPKWVFRQGSKGGSNGAPVLLVSEDFIVKALFQAFKEAFIQTQLQEVSASLDFVLLFAKRVLNNFIENLLSLVKEIIHAVIFYVEIVLSDASGTAGVGMRQSFVVTGEAIVDLLRWLIHTLATFIVNLGRPSNPIVYPTFPKSFFSELFLSFEVLFTVGMPKMVRVLGAVGDLDHDFTMAVSISPNIPALGKVMGRNWGNWSVEFGAYLEGVPAGFAMGFLVVQAGKYIDFWLFKGRVYGL